MRFLKFYNYVIPTVFVTVGITFYNCTHDKSPAPVVSGCNTPEAVSFHNDIIPVFKNNCSTSGCHTGANPAGNLCLDDSVAYKKLMKHGSGYIDTLHPDFSLLYSQMISSSTPMPPSGKLDNCKIALVFKWIQQKAKNN